MKLTVKNIAKVSFAEILVDGITVIGGYNSSGKSTVCKCLYSVLSCTSDMSGKIKKEVSKSLFECILNSTETNNDYASLIPETEIKAQRAAESMAHCCGLGADRSDVLAAVKKNVPFALDSEAMTDEICKILNTDISLYINFIFNKSFNGIFNGQINTIDSEPCGSVSVLCGEEENVFTIENNLVSVKNYKSMRISYPIYIESRSVLDEHAVGGFVRSGVSLSTSQYLFRENNNDDITLQGFTKRLKNAEIIDEILESVLVGRLEKSDGTLVFSEKQLSEPIRLSNMASGLKIFAMIKKLIENGTLEHSGFLIIDEPEVNLHPEWQIKLAKVLVLMCREFDIRLVINTHSPYLIRAIESFSSEYDMLSKTKLYFMSESDSGMFHAGDVTETPDVIYKTLYTPLENL